jgi:hypothetical protein
MQGTLTNGFPLKEIARQRTGIHGEANWTIKRVTMHRRPEQAAAMSRNLETPIDMSAQIEAGTMVVHTGIRQGKEPNKIQAVEVQIKETPVKAAALAEADRQGVNNKF